MDKEDEICDSILTEANSSDDGNSIESEINVENLEGLTYMQNRAESKGN